MCLADEKCRENVDPVKLVNNIVCYETGLNRFYNSVSLFEVVLYGVWVETISKIVISWS